MSKNILRIRIGRTEAISHITDLAEHRMIGNITKMTQVDVLIGAMLDSRTVGTMKEGREPDMIISCYKRRHFEQEIPREYRQF